MTEGAARLLRNRRRQAAEHPITLAGSRAAREAIGACPRYAPTPLRSLDGLARHLGIRALHYKDEASRFGLGSFKALGAVHAVGRARQRQLAAATGRGPGLADLIGGAGRGAESRMTVACATEGNHGRAVAAGARLFGCDCVIYLHAGVDPAREEAIRRAGAVTVRSGRDYDEAVAAVADAALREGWRIISDTSTGGHEQAALDVMHGYTVLVQEVLDQLRGGPLTHVFLQAGVGGLAAAAGAYLAQILGPAAPALVVVEPDAADCLLRSARAGALRPAAGAPDTALAGLACGEASPVAWSILDACADAFMTIPDETAFDTVRALAGDRFGDGRIVAGASGAAGLGGLVLAAGDARLRRRLGLTAESVVLVVGTEGATDPDAFLRITGGPP
ncbi:MAG TPA: diaminopropionate ammonia-lyase [Azospirillaceae bacterium]|nr:diaminopropionate ammonia-lyase [Azospirillaceae bacterium]